MPICLKLKVPQIDHKIQELLKNSNFLENFEHMVLILVILFIAVVYRSLYKLLQASKVRMIFIKYSISINYA